MLMSEMCTKQKLGIQWHSWTMVRDAHANLGCSAGMYALWHPRSTSSSLNAVQLCLFMPNATCNGLS